MDLPLLRFLGNPKKDLQNCSREQRFVYADCAYAIQHGEPSESTDSAGAPVRRVV